MNNWCNTFADHGVDAAIVAAFPMPEATVIDASVKRPGPLDGTAAWNKFRAERYGRSYARKYNEVRALRRSATN